MAHKIASVDLKLLTMIGGAILVVTALLVPVPVLIWVILVCAIVPIVTGVIYSHRLARRQAS